MPPAPPSNLYICFPDVFIGVCVGDPALWAGSGVLRWMHHGTVTAGAWSFFGFLFVDRFACVPSAGTEAVVVACAAEPEVCFPPAASLAAL